MSAAHIPAEPEISHIERSPGVCGGKPRIAGTRIRVQDVVVWCERLGLSADEVASRHPQLGLASIYAALAYYHDHRTEIEDELRRSEELVEQMRKAYPSKLLATPERSE